MERTPPMTIEWAKSQASRYVPRENSRENRNFKSNFQEYKKQTENVVTTEAEKSEKVVSEKKVREKALEKEGYNKNFKSRFEARTGANE